MGNGRYCYITPSQAVFDAKVPLGAAHREAMRNLRLYMLVGGMPQAVNEYLDTNNLSKTDAVKREIIELYLDDFRKLTKQEELPSYLRVFLPN